MGFFELPWRKIKKKKIGVGRGQTPSSYKVKKLAARGSHFLLNNFLIKNFGVGLFLVLVVLVVVLVAFRLVVTVVASHYCDYQEESHQNHHQDHQKQKTKQLEASTNPVREESQTTA